MKIAVMGGKGFQNYETLKAVLDTHKITKIILCGSKKTNTLTQKYAVQKEILCKRILPDWQLHGLEAGSRRQELIVDECEKLIVFWDGSSGNVEQLINCAKSKEREVTVIGYSDKEPI